MSRLGGTCSPSAATPEAALLPALLSSLLFLTSGSFLQLAAPSAPLRLGRARWTGTLSPSPSFCPFLTRWGRGLPRQPPTPCLSPRWWNSSASGTGGSLRGALGPRPSRRPRPPGHHQPAGSPAAAPLCVAQEAVLSPRASLLAGRALPRRLERNVSLRKSAHTRKGKGAPSLTTAPRPTPHPVPLASHLGLVSRRDRASGGPGGGGRGGVRPGGRWTRQQGPAGRGEDAWLESV